MTEFFDVNHWLGSSQHYIAGRKGNAEGKKEIIENIKKRLDENNIKKCIIASKLASGYDWKTGNDRLLETGLSENIEGLYYGLALNPDAYFRYEFSDYLEEAYKNNVRLFRMFPRSHLFYLNDHYMKKIYKILSRKKFPVMLDLKQLDITGNKYFDIDVLEKVLEENPGMPFILETTLKQCMFSRFYFPLLERFKNLYLEASSLLLYDQIEHYVKRFGSERLIFGTNYPGLPIEINTARIILSGVSEADKDNIVHRNLERIMGGIEIG
jgi:hypothetical protein